MQLLLTFIFCALSLAVLAALYLFYKKISASQKSPDSDQHLFVMLQNQIQETNRLIDQKMNETNKTMNDTRHNLNQTIQDQFGQSAKFIRGITEQSNKMIVDITEKLTSLDKTNQQVIGFSEQLNNLEKVLTSQKTRGNLGEAGLQLVLENILPPGAYKSQYQFEDGDIVDAVIITKEGMIPIDAKFSLTNYQRLFDEKDERRRVELEKEFKNDLKKRIDETSKYIKPKYGTMEFAFMFIPAEAIYYDLLVNQVGAIKSNTRNMIDYAFTEKKVIIVSPTTFSAYLQTVLQGLRAFKIEESAKEIRENVQKLGKHIITYEDFMKKLGSSIGTSVNHYNHAYKELAKIDKDVVRITQGERAIEPELIEKPAVE
ncbi:MAG: DNA recombination protein RmuC [bacterium]